MYIVAVICVLPKALFNERKKTYLQPLNHSLRLLNPCCIHCATDYIPMSLRHTDEYDMMRAHRKDSISVSRTPLN